MLSTIGELPVQSLEDALPPEATAAVVILDEVDLETQSRGWNFNAEDEVTLTPDVDGNILVPPDIIRVAVDRGRYPNLDVTTRANPDGDFALYDKKNKTFAFGQPIKASVVYLFDFERTPQAYRRYVTCRAARIFQDRAVGSQPHHQYNEMDEMAALRFLKQHEGFTDNRTLLDNFSSSQIINRARPRVFRV